MSKFSSFLVFAFGLVLILAMAFTIVRSKFFPPAPPPPEERTLVAKSDLPPLDAGTRDQFLAQLDQLYTSGGLDAVRDYVAKEWMPGRVVRGNIFSTADVTSARIIDREVRRCDRQGGALLDKAPILPRSTPDLHIGREAHLETWTRIKDLQSFSFYLTVWYVGE
jgi:hypothetical protein